MRPLLLILALSLATGAVCDRTQAQGLAYEPPDVDYVYPPPPDSPDPVASPDDPATVRPPTQAAPQPQGEQAAPAGERPVPPSPPPSAQPAQVQEPAPTAPPTAPVPAPVPDDAFAASATVERKPEARLQISQDEARDMPGAFGDPLRVVETLPGVVPISNGLPYFYIRGAPPAAQGFVYDDIWIPQLFHLGLLPEVVPPRAIGRSEIYPGVAPTRYGRRAGAIVAARPPRPAPAMSGELDLRLIDINGWLEVPVGRGHLSLGGRYGYPGLALKLFSPETTLTYWDGVLRYETPLARHQRLQLVWLASFDDLEQPPWGTGPAETNAARLHFQRAEARVLHDLVGGGTFGLALTFGFDDATLGNALKARAVTLGPRLWIDLPLGSHHLELGADYRTSTGDIRDPNGSIDTPDGLVAVSVPAIAEAAARAQGGAYAELTLRTSPRTSLTLGTRLDTWSVRGDVTVAADPRIVARAYPTRALDLQLSLGMAHQPAVFLLPLPGLSEVALDDGLTRALQADLGAGLTLPAGVRAEAKWFVHAYKRMLLPELQNDAEVSEDPARADILNYGLELFLKRAISHALAGTLSYTLSWAEAESSAALLQRFRPDFDVRHVLNAVLSYRVWGGLKLGVRFQARSGRLISQETPRYRQRLPWFVRADARVGYSWRGRWAPRMTAYLEWLNVTAQPEHLDADCLVGRCRALSAPVVTVPNAGVRASF